MYKIKGLMGSFQRKLKGFYVFAMLILMTLILQQCLNSNNNVEAKKLQQHSTKTLKLFKSSSSLVQLRHKRDVFTNDQQQQQQHQQRKRESFVKDNMKYNENLDVNDDGTNDSNNDYYSDENYDVLPNGFDGNTSSPPPSFGDQISEKAKQVAESFANMWQSLGESVKHCVQAIHAFFDDDDYDEGGEVAGQENGNLTPEQRKQQVFLMEREYHLKPEYDNEVYENNL
ncbi:uncharacterized protein ACRADG_007800 [Cochliomyia hominivorax]